MGFGLSRRFENNNTTDDETQQQSGLLSGYRQQSSSSTSGSQTGNLARKTRTIESAEDHYEMTIPNTKTLQRLRSHEELFGADVHQWIDEGMPTDIMGKTRDMEAFRQRQVDRPPEVPTNIERQNNRSVQRSQQAVTETDPAGETGVPDPVRDVISSTGQSLDTSIQRVMEDRMGESFGDVQVHTGSTATEACESINARAFTVGNHIAFNQGEYDPSSADGQHVLAHELAHVRQQTGGAVSMLPQEDLGLEIDPDPQLEREAEETAQQVMQGGEIGIQRLEDTEVHIQRSKNSGETAVLASALDETSDLKDQISSIQGQVDTNTADIESLSQTVDEAVQLPDFAELEGELTTEDGGFSDDLLTHLTELNKAQAGMAGGAMVTAGVATGNPALIGGGLSVALGGPVGLNALEEQASSEEEVDLSGEFLNSLADAVAKRLDERGIGFGIEGKAQGGNV